MLTLSPVARYLSLAPSVLIFAALAVLPVANLVFTSFFEVSWLEGRKQMAFVGLENYARIPGDPLFRAGIVNTTILVIVATTAQVVLGLVLALACARIGYKSRFYRALLILPILIPGIVIGAIWRLMYNAEFGIINLLLQAVGFPGHDWLGSTSTALAAVIVVDIWHWTPFSFLLLLAAVESLPRDVTEAAKVDGATEWQRFRYVTFPLLIPALMMTFLFRAVIAFKVFDEVFLLTSGGPGTATEVVSFTIYQRFFLQDQTGYGSALSVTVIAVVSLIIVIAMTAGSGKVKEQ
ncbi:binding-protein-dependent transport system inner membrane protein [Roseobacter cerasinus]|uniref:Binding-protein-dependent transport system inner membrane protein n=1 Tax=Roseobacter cerasinus TaxID=2602289 RepID=A0A640VX04_9RHOB|nr:sugar ABC transporter permease [Roseobacter cerasinus]GFE51900.1 binding-protein-dependent transport system inner membrane protein [Roseobacter cerasinus]